MFVSSIPDVRRLPDLLQCHRSATGSWRTFGICQAMPAATDTGAQRAAVSARQASFDSAPAEVCAASGRCRWDGE